MRYIVTIYRPGKPSYQVGRVHAESTVEARQRAIEKFTLVTKEELAGLDVSIAKYAPKASKVH